MFNYFTAHQSAQNTTEAVGHHQEHTLCASADFRANFFLHEYRARDVEEVEGAAVNNHRQNQQHGTERCRIAVGKQAETQHPRHNTDKHYILNTVTAQEERDGQDKQRLGNLRDRHHHRGVFNDEATGEQRVVIETVQEGITEHIGNLQFRAQHH